MKVFVSWSGGKDCMLALYRIIQANNHRIFSLVNMCSANSEHSGSHGIKSEYIKSQAQQLNINIIQQPVDNKGYETNFKTVIQQLKTNGVEAGVFGDIYLQAHRDWIDRVCNEMEIKAIFPLWHNNTNDLLKEFIDYGFKTKVVSVNSNFLNKSWLGRDLDVDFLKDISKLPNIDACAENGEYHSFVYDGPIFNAPLLIERGNIRYENEHWLLNLKVKGNA